MKTLLLVDDEPIMLDLLSLYLSPLDFKCIKSTSGMEAIKLIDSNHVDLILLDVMMPNMDGWETCREIRKNWNTPIIMLTARTEKADIVKGLENGADDYIAKPFDEEELVARINAVLRRLKSDSKKIFFKGLKLDKSSFQVTYNGQEIVLTPKEFSLLSLFLSNQNMVFTREHLITTIWGYNVSTEDRTIDSHIRNLRDKLRKTDFPADTYLQTVWGVGYKWTLEI
ncbi:response regulator transcription factor [Niallia sp. JL1B1071]|uniref:response regulator transcription factor n=1 Tax=Niallia tiangongensis TaxID=3237105 RepID=UPI0037DCB503